jgi:hypothetical protein
MLTLLRGGASMYRPMLPRDHLDGLLETLPRIVEHIDFPKIRGQFFPCMPAYSTTGPDSHSACPRGILATPYAAQESGVQ